MLPRRILCPIELPSGCERARRVATRLAQETNIEARLVSGTAAETILELAEPTDLIVIEAQGRTGLSRLLLGSTPEKVARHARCSVLVVDPLAEPRCYGNILVAVDFSAWSRRAVELAGDLASLCGAAVTLLHVIELPVFGQDDDLRAAGVLDDWSELIEAQTRTRVTRLLRTGDPAPQVLSCAAEDPSLDLLVVGSRGRTGIERMLLGSVAEQVVRHATRTVMVAR